MQAYAGSEVSAIDASALALASLIAPLTGAVLVRQRIIYKSVAVPRLAAIEGSAVRKQGAFIFEDDAGTHNCIATVPAIVESAIMSTGPGAGVLIDQSNADIIAFVETYLGGIWTNPFADDMSVLVAAYLQSRV